MPAALPVPVSNAHVGDLSIGDLAAVAGVPRDGLRFYGACGLIRVRRRSNGYRVYPPEIVELVQYVRATQQLGLILTKIREGILHV